MKYISLYILTTFVFVWSNGAYATERVVLNFYDQVYKGETTLFLKKELRRQHPNIDINTYNLVKVRLVAKTRRGHGGALLKVGSWMSQERRIYGNPDDFHRDRPRTFDRVDFYNDSYRQRGRTPWQMQLKGFFKVRKVVLELQRQRLGDGREGQEAYVRCESHRGKKKFCYAAEGVLNAHLAEQLSFNSCVLGSTWGYNNNSIWVDDGCRGVFRVITRRGSPIRH